MKQARSRSTIGLDGMGSDGGCLPSSRRAGFAGYAR
jgi:hypothetical protein